MQEIQRYTVNILFNKDGSKVLLQKKDHTAFAGMLNGIGGKIKDSEEPTAGAFRKIKEDASLQQKNLERWEWIGTLTLPEQCDTKNKDKFPELWFFAGIVTDESLAQKPGAATEDIEWILLNERGEPITNLKLAGDGDLQYFIGRAKKQLFGGTQPLCR